MKKRSHPKVHKLKFGLFSYVGSVGRVPTQRIKKQEIAQVKEIRKRFEKSDLFSNSGYINVGCEYFDLKNDVAEKAEKIQKIFEVHNEIFRPSGPVQVAYSSYPHLPADKFKPYKPYNEKFNKKNFLTTCPKKVFSTLKYFEKSVHNFKSNIKIDKKKVHNKSCSFISTTYPSSYFNPDTSVYGLPAEEISQSFFKSEKSDEKINTQESLEEVKNKIFKPIGKSNSEIFSTFEYLPEIEFPAKKRKPLLPKLHKIPFKSVTTQFTVPCPEVITNPINLKREFHLRHS